MGQWIATALAFWSCTSDSTGLRHVFVEDVTRCVCLNRGGWYVVGQLDTRGEFTETFRISSKGPIGGGVKIGTVINYSLVEGAQIYELRSGALIPGTFNSERFFVPEVSGMIIKFSDYVFTNTAPKIWNLPGFYLSAEDAKIYRAPRVPPIVMDPGFNFSK